MIAKKNQKVDLERKRFAFFQIGLLVSGSLCLAAFEYTSADPEETHVAVMQEEDNTLGIEEVYDLPEQPQTQKTATLRQEVIDEVDIVKTKPTDGLVVKYDKKIKFDEGDEDVLNFNTIEEEDIIYDFPAVEPEFIGGQDAMYKWISDHIIYPELLAGMNLGGLCYVQFVVNEDGTISSVKEISEEESDVDEEFKNEAVRVVKMMPKWKPGENAGKKVKVRYTIPIRFIAH